MQNVPITSARCKRTNFNPQRKSGLIKVIWLPAGINASVWKNVLCSSDWWPCYHNNSCPSMFTYTGTFAPPGIFHAWTIAFNDNILFNLLITRDGSQQPLHFSHCIVPWLCASTTLIITSTTSRYFLSRKWGLLRTVATIAIDTLRRSVKVKRWKLNEKQPREVAMFYLNWARSHLSLFVILLLFFLVPIPAICVSKTGLARRGGYGLWVVVSRIAFARESEMIIKRFGVRSNHYCCISCCLLSRSRSISSR